MNLPPYLHFLLVVLGLVVSMPNSCAQLTATIQPSNTSQANGTITLVFPAGYPVDQVEDVIWYPLDDSHNHLTNSSGNTLLQLDDDPSTPTAIGGLAPGWYRVSFGRRGWCNPAKKDFEVSSCTLPIPNFAITPACGNSGLGNVILNIDAPLNYNYLWSDGSSKQDLIGVPVGIYKITITDQQTNCKANIAFNITDALSAHSDYSTVSGISEVAGENLQIYATLFTNTTYANFFIPAKSEIKLYVHNSSGILLQTLINDEMYEKGSYSTLSFGNHYDKGVYFVTLEVCNTKYTKRIMKL